MAKIIYVNYEFINKNGKERKVRFPMEAESYKAYHDPSVPKEWTDKMMQEEYQEYCDERNYRKHVTSWPLDEDGNEIDFVDESQNMEEILIQKDKEEQQKAMIEKIISQMSPKQREAYRLVMLEGMTQEEARTEMGLEQSAFSKLLQRAKETFEKILSKENF